MNKNGRKGVLRRKDSPCRKKPLVTGQQKSSDGTTTTKVEKSVRNRCCLVHPRQIDFGNLTQSSKTLKLLNFNQDIDANKEFPDRDSYLISKQCESEQILDDQHEIRHVTKKTVENCSQYAEISDSTQSHNTDNREVHSESADDIPTSLKNIHISHVPKVKIIAEKFSKYRRNHVELRKMEEKIVCVEYDVYDQDAVTVVKPVQKLRAFFSIKPKYEDVAGPNLVMHLPSKIKHMFRISDEDLNQLTEKEIEIIDTKIGDNNSYIKDLQRILKQVKFMNEKKCENYLDLHSLYEMAKRDKYILNTDLLGSFITAEALQEVKELILQQQVSSVHGINRRYVHSANTSQVEYQGLLSQTIVAELLREDIESGFSK